MGDNDISLNENLVLYIESTLDQNSSQEAESREISISCWNLFLNHCKINMFKLKLKPI